MRFVDRLPNYSDDAILAELRRAAVALGNDTLRVKDLARARISYTLLKERFGGLRNALRKAGLPSPPFYRNIPDNDLMVELQRVWNAVLEREGRRPRKRDLRRYGCRYSHHPYCRRWGSWIKACEALLIWEEQDLPNGGVLPDTVDGRPPRAGPRPKRDISLRLRYEVLKRDSFRCVSCGRSPATHRGVELQVDHIVPESAGGRTEADNLRALCRECNLGKGAL